MFRMTEKRYKYLKSKITEVRESNERKRVLLQELGKALNIKRPSESKLALRLVFFYVFEFTLFCQYMMYVTGDTSALSAVFANMFVLVATVLGYYHKAGKENTQGGITYESAMLEKQNFQSDVTASG